MRQTTHDILVRARTDVAFDVPPPLTVVEPSAVHLDGGRWETRANELAEYRRANLSATPTLMRVQRCGRMPNDWFAFGLRASMLEYARLLDAAPAWLPHMQSDPALRQHSHYRPGVRPAGTFLNNQEGTLGYWLRASGLSCINLDLKGMRLCGWRVKLGHSSLRGAQLGCDAVVYQPASVTDPAQWCGKTSKQW